MTGIFVLLFEYGERTVLLPQKETWAVASHRTVDRIDAESKQVKIIRAYPICLPNDLLGVRYSPTKRVVAILVMVILP